MILASLFISAILSGDPMLKPGDHTRKLKVDGLDRSYLVHIPAKYDGKTPTPVVLALHGAAMNGPMMAVFCGLNKKADEAGFIAVYPSGTGMGIFLIWNAGGIASKDRADDVAYIRKALGRPWERGQGRSQAGLCHGDVQRRHDVLPPRRRTFGSDRRRRPCRWNDGHREGQSQAARSPHALSRHRRHVGALRRADAKTRPSSAGSSRWTIRSGPG